MYRALYPYKSNDENALTFYEGDSFTLIDSGKDAHWWLVQNGKGQVGFVPANYLQKDEASLSDVVKSIDRAIAAVHAEGSRAPGGFTNLQRANLQKLQKHRENVIEEQRQQKSHGIHLRQAESVSSNNQHKTGENSQSSKRMSQRSAPPPPPVRNAQSVLSDSTELNLQSYDSPNRLKKNVHQNQSSHNSNESPAKVVVTKTSPGGDAKDLNVLPNVTKAHSAPALSNVYVPKEIGAELVEKIRSSTRLTYKDSIAAVHTVILHIKQRIPGVDAYMCKILETLYIESENTDVDLTTDDAKRLEHIFEELAKCKDDSQQRSWFLHEDEHIITELLEDLLSILNGANTDICKAMIAKDHYAAVDNLVLYYQMETRLKLRMLLLQVFGSLCGLSSKIISELLNSVLPCELARDIQTDTQEIQKFCYSSLVLAMVFSQGEPLPQQFYMQFNEAFINYLLETIENPPSTDVGEQVPDLLLNVILSFNLHYELPEENTVMEVIAKKGTAKVLTEKLLLLVNRGDDPVRMFDHKPKPPNAVLKFLSDLYSSTSTSNLLYTNDVKVLIDIVLRQLTDLSTGDDLRTEYLSIMQLILKNHNYADHCHRKQQLETCFKQIYNEEEPSSDMDKRIVMQIWIDLPDLFESDCV